MYNIGERVHLVKDKGNLYGDNPFFRTGVPYKIIGKHNSRPKYGGGFNLKLLAFVGVRSENWWFKDTDLRPEKVQFVEEGNWE